MVDTRIEKFNENFHHKVCTIDFDKLFKKFNGDEKKIKNEIKQDLRDIFIDANRQKSPETQFLNFFMQYESGICFFIMSPNH